MEKNEKILKFSVFTQDIYNYVPELTERRMSGRKWLNYGKDNKLPFYLYDCYEKSALMNSIINTTVDFVLGNDIVTTLPSQVNAKGDTIEDFIKDITLDYMIYGGFSFQIIYNKLGEVNELYWLDFRKCRTDEELTTVYYSKEWNLKASPAYIEYDIWKPNEANRGSKVFYFNGSSRSIYPVPRYSGSLPAIQTNIEIQKFHLNAIRNNFNSNFLINFNTGVPADDVQKDIERQMKEKFCGAENAAKFMVGFAEGKDQSPTILRIPEDNFDKKYDALAKSTTQAIFTGFSAPQQLFGGMVEGSLFNKQEYQEAFDLYNRLQVQPIQMMLQRILNSVYGKTDGNIIEFKPFALDAEENQEQKITPETNE